MRTFHFFLSFVFIHIFCSVSHAQVLTSWTDKATCLFGYKNEKGEWAIPARYRYAADFDNTTHLAVVGNDDKYGLIDRHGRVIAEIKYPSVSSSPVTEYVPAKGVWRCYVVFFERNLCGLMDTMGKICVPARFTNIQWKQGRFIGISNGFADTSGKILGTDMRFRGFTNGLAIFSRYKNIRHADDEGEDDVPSKKMIKEPIEVYGMVDTEGQIRLPAIYTDITQSYLPLYLVTGIDGKKGVVAYDGSVLIPAIYDNIEDFFHTQKLLELSKGGNTYLYDYIRRHMLFKGGSFIRGPVFESDLVTVCINHKYGIGNLNGETVLKPQFDNMSPTSVYGQYKVKKGRLSGLIDSSGLYLIRPEYSEIEELVVPGSGPATVPRLYSVRTGQKWGIVACNGKIYLKPAYDHIDFNSRSADSIFFTCIKGRVAKTAVLYQDKTEIREFSTSVPITIIGARTSFAREMQLKYQLLYARSNLPVIRKSKSYMINNYGHVVMVSSKYTFGENFGPDKIAVYENGNMGIMSAGGKIIVPVIYKRIVGVNNYHAVHRAHYFLAIDINNQQDSFYYCELKKNGKLGVLDKEFNMVLPAIYSSVSDNRGCWFARVKDNAPWVMISPDGKRILQDTLAAVPLDFGNIFTVSAGNRYAAMDKKGNLITPYTYQAMIFIFPHKFLVEKEGKWGIMEDKGTNIVPCEFESIGPFVDGYATVIRNGRYGIIDSGGRFIVKPVLRNILNSPVPFASLYRLKHNVNDVPDLYNNLCHITGKTKDSIPGITTLHYFYGCGFYDLLDQYPDNGKKNIINNYMVNLFLGSRYFYEPAYGQDNAHDIAYVSNIDEIPEEHQMWEEGHDRDHHCGQTDYSIVIVSKNIAGIRSSSVYSTDFGPLNKNGGMGDEISYKYLWLDPDSVQVINIDMIFKSKQWVDTLANRCRDLESKKPEQESRYCTTPSQIASIKKQEYEKIRAAINPAAFTIEKNGLSWGFGYNNTNYRLTLSYKELAPFFKPGNCLEELM